MTQISANTLTYDQIYLKIKNFFIKDTTNKFGSNQERLAEYKSLISDIYESVGGPSTKIDLFIKGEPPVSDKFNNFAQSLSEDFMLVSKQLDYLNAKTVNAYNLFAQEIDAEKKYLERVSSKAKILQMYTEAPAEDLVYLGDSFDNQDQIDVTQIAIGLNPHIDNGSFSLPVFRSRPWYPRSITIDTQKSNGFLGNYHQVKKSINYDSSSEYEFIYKNNKSLPSLSSISDENTLTYFEYEGINVDKSSNSLADKNLVSNNEFSYIANRKFKSGKVDGQLIDWSNFDMSNNLKLTLIFETGSPTLANCLNIVPYFGSCDLIKVSSVDATLQDGTKINILSEPIYIGSSFAPTSLQISKNYFYNKATVRFSEIRVLKFEVTLEQESFKDIDIQHVYWKPNYQSTDIIESPFNGLSRFNPDALSADIYELVEYDKYSIIPEITLPAFFKDKDRISKIAKVKIKKRPETFSGYAIVLKAKVNDSRLEKTFYFYNFNNNTDEPNDFGWVDNLSDLFQPSKDSLEYFGSPKYSKNIDELTADLNRINSYLGFDSATPSNIIIVNSPYTKYEFSRPSIESVTYTTATQATTYSVPISIEKELYQAKRKCIGLRDLSFYHETYADRAEIVSTTYKYDNSIESLMLSVDSSVDNNFDDKLLLNYYISVNNSNWIQIAPVQMASVGIAEVLVFNQNIPINYQIPGVSYLNYPTIPSEINSVRVKIEMFKDRLYNITPVVYSYKLIAKVKK